MIIGNLINYGNVIFQLNYYLVNQIKIGYIPINIT